MNVSWTVMGSEGTTIARERALRALYDEQAADLFAYVIRLLGGDRHRAEDVVQETMLRCWNTQKLEEGQPLRPWLFRVARNLIVDQHRARKARPQEIFGNTWLDDLGPACDHVDQLLSSMVLAEAFQRLSPMYRDVLYETYFVGRSVRETALVLGIPPGTVKSRTYHAVRALRAAMGVAGATADKDSEELEWRSAA